MLLSTHKLTNSITHKLTNSQTLYETFLFLFRQFAVLLYDAGTKYEDGGE